jgi:hypothetical protein
LAARDAPRHTTGHATGHAMINAPRQLRTVAAAGAVLAAVWVGAIPIEPARAQDEPIVVGEQQKPRKIDLYNFRGALDLLWRNRRDELKSPGAPEQRFRENRFEETFTLESDGHIYHPNLVELDLAGKFGLTQTEIDQTGESGDDTQFGTLYEWDLNATILRKEVAPLTLYTRRTQDQLNREFGPTIDNTYTQHGAIWDIRSKTVPTRFEIFHSDQEQKGIADDVGDFSLIQDSFLWHSEYRPRRGHTLTWDYTLSYVQEETEGFNANDYLLNDANLTYSIDFGPGERNNLSSSLSYLDQGGDFPIERLRWNEFLRLRHTADFETRYQYTFDKQEFSGIGQDRHRGTAGFIHRLYESLTTTGNVGGEFIDYDDGSQTHDLFADVQFDYRKEVPLGVLTAFIGGAFDYQINDVQVTARAVVDAPRTFVDPAPITLIGNNIDPASIVITNSNGLIMYQEGIDYDVEVFPNRVEIRRVLGGRIASGETVLIDYLLLPQAENKVTTRTYFFGGRYDIERGLLRGTGIYGRFTRQDQDVDSDFPLSFTPNSFDDLVFGIEYRRWGFTVGAEHETYDSTISPFEANRYFANYAKRLRRDLTLDLGVTYQQIDYTDVDNHLDLLTVSGSVVYRITPRLFLTGTVTWRDEQDDLRGPTRGLEEQLQINWYHRQTSFYGLIRNADLDSPFTDNSFQVFEIGIRREF